MACNQCFLSFNHKITVLLLFFNLQYIFAKELASTNGYVRREHSLTKPFQVGSTGLQYWEFAGTTAITNNYIRLTSDYQSQQGILWNSLPIDARDWEIHIHFAIHGSGETLFGDGFSFFYTRDTMEFGPVFGSKNFFSGLAIFFDTYSNENGEHAHEHPYISAMINNGSLPYDHDRDGTHSQLEGCSASIRNRDAETFVLIQYLGSKEHLTVLTDIENAGEWKPCFEATGVRLPTAYHIGFSAATGDLADNHDIIGVKFYELEIAKDEETVLSDEDTDNIVPFAAGAEPSRDRVDDPTHGSFSPKVSKIATWFFWFMVALCLICFVGLIIYKKQQEAARKRFF